MIESKAYLVRDAENRKAVGLADTLSEIIQELDRMEELRGKFYWIHRGVAEIEIECGAYYLAARNIGLMAYELTPEAESFVQDCFALWVDDLEADNG